MRKLRPNGWGFLFIEWPTSVGVCHQVFATDKAEYGDIVVLVEDAQGAEDFVDGRATGGYVVYNEHILLADDGAELFVRFAGKLEKLHHVGAEPALPHVLGNGEVVFLMDEVEHLVDGLLGFIFLGCGIARTAVF